MTKLSPSLLFICFALFFSACTGSKSFYKKGKKLDESGMTLEAANFYIEALKRKGSNTDAMIALNKTGQAALDNMLADFYKNYSAERFKDAVYNYTAAQDFKAKVADVGITLKQAPYYQDYFDEAKGIYIAELYDQAQSHLDNEEFEDATTLLKEVQNLDPKYKNVKSLHDFAFVEPKYRQALHKFDLEHFRESYTLFAGINKHVPEGYKESKAYEELALESAQFTIGVLPFENQTAVKAVETGISASTIAAIHDLNDPFLKLVDRSQSDKLLDEQLYNMSEMVNQEFAVETGAALGTKAILVGKVINARQLDGRLSKQRKTGWLGKEVKYVDQTTGAKKKKIVYSKVYYYELEQERKINCTFQFQLISTATGEILSSDIIEVSKRDRVQYATFNGNTKFLVPGFWKSQSKKDAGDKIYNSYSYKRTLDQKLNARKTLKSMSALSTSLYEDIGQQIAEQIGAFNPEL